MNNMKMSRFKQINNNLLRKKILYNNLNMLYILF